MCAGLLCAVGRSEELAVVLFLTDVLKIKDKNVKPETIYCSVVSYFIKYILRQLSLAVKDLVHSSSSILLCTKH